MSELVGEKMSRFQRVRKNLSYAMSLAWAASPKLLLRFTLLGMFNAIMPPVSVYLGSVLVNKIAAAQVKAIPFENILYIIIGLWITFIVQRAVGAYMSYGRNLFIRKVELEAERRLLEMASKIDLGHFDNSDWHDRLARAKRDVSWRPGDLTWSILGLSSNIVTIILMAGLLASLHYVLVLLALGAAVLQLALESRVTSRLYKYYYKETTEERERQYLGDLLVEPKNTKEVRAFVLADYLLGRHKKLSDHLFSEREKISRLGSRMSLVTGFVTGTVLALAYVFVGLKGVTGVINPGAVVLVIGAFTSVSGTLQNISQTFVAVDQHTTFLEDYFSFLTIQPLVPVSAHPIPIPGGPIESIEFENVSFTYPGGTETAVDGLDLKIRRGELIALFSSQYGCDTGRRWRG
ncbi:MAG TPA: ABC transporter ATP-binding protein, partial [Chitinophagaceae bacterium]|nr:ABC transporter ATP-binding protein [Chitinophagaceae bacterium]